MNSIDAAYSTVHDYPGGSESLGPRVGISPAVLRNKVNPNNDTHHLTFAEARRIADMTGDFEQIAGFMVACGSFGQEIHASLADGKVTKDEIAKVEGRAREVMTAAAEIKQRMEGMSE
jgi:hypothetical protein